MNKKAIHRIISSVWTIEYREVTPTSIEIVRYSREDEEGYEQEHKLPQGDVIEDAERTVTGAIIDGKTYTVTNPKFVFSYNA